MAQDGIEYNLLVCYYYNDLKDYNFNRCGNYNLIN